MRIPRQSYRFEAGFNMTPMIDVVFQLLIFFLVTGHLAQQEFQLELPLPVATSGDDLPEEQSPHIVVNVLGSGGYDFRGRSMSLDELRPTLQAILADKGGDLEVRIRSDRGAPYGHVEPLLRSCAEIGLWNVTFAVYRPEDAP